MTDYLDLDNAELMLGATAVILGEDHAATLALALAVTTRKPADIKRSRLARAPSRATSAKPSLMWSRRRGTKRALPSHRALSRPFLTR